MQAVFPDRDWCAVAPLSTMDWLPVEPAVVPQAVLGWLSEQGSLTRRLRAERGDLSVVCLQQGIRDEDPALWQRQVLLLKSGRPWVWGLTQAPLATLAHYPLLATQGEQPLGDWLFGVAGATREGLVWTDLVADPALQEALQAWLLPSPPVLWARRSRLVLPCGECVITEVFLPDAPLYAGIEEKE